MTKPGSMRVRGPRAGLLAAGMAAVLGACAGDEAPPQPCPRIVVLDEASRQVKFDGAGRDLTDVEFEAVVSASGLSCEYDEGELEVEMTVRVEAGRGPADDDRQAEVGYFAAVVRGERTVRAREEYRLAIPFEGNRTRMAAVEELAHTIPLAPGETGADYTIYVGLTLTPEELEYNRRRR